MYFQIYTHLFTDHCTFCRRLRMSFFSLAAEIIKTSVCMKQMAQASTIKLFCGWWGRREEEEKEGGRWKGSTKLLLQNTTRSSLFS